MAHKEKRVIPFCFQVYKVICRVNGKGYIGKTTYPLSYRRYGHKSAEDRNRGSVFHKAIKKYGWENFDMFVLYEGVSEREINTVERALISEHNTLVPNGYNLTIGGDGATGCKRSAESIEKGAAKRRGVPRPDVTKNLKGKKRPAEFCALMSQIKKTHSVSSATRIAQSIAVRRAVICTTNDTIYSSMSHAAKYLGLRVSAVSFAARGIRPSAAGFNFVFADESRDGFQS